MRTLDDDKLYRAISRGAQAEALIRNELLQEAFTALDAEYVTAWRVTPVRDSVAREKLWQAVNVLALVKRHLGMIVSNGKLAQAELKQMTDNRP
jgi:hypothetical protein